MNACISVPRTNSKAFKYIFWTPCIIFYPSGPEDDCQALEKQIAHIPLSLFYVHNWGSVTNKGEGGPEHPETVNVVAWILGCLAKLSHK